jgi:hypothetical protein
MKSFNDFINEEAKLKGNIGVPEEKLKEIERKAEQEKGIRIDDQRQAGQLGGQIMGLVNRSRQLMFSGKSREECAEIEERLVDLAKSVINTEYGDILQNVELDIKLVPFGQVANELEDIRDVPQRPSEQQQRQQAQDLEDEDPEEEKEETTDKKKSFFDNLFGSKPKKEKEDFLKSEEYKLGVDVAKLINAIGQGEAKNTKNILHSDIVKNGLRDIFGRSAEELFKVWDDTSKVADKLDWVIPIEVKAQMMADQMGGMAGAVQVSWPEAEERREDEESGEETGPSSQDAEDILKNIEEGGDLDDNKEEISELLSNGNPKINAVGVDFPMLLHETVKGIYQLIGSAWLPAMDASEKDIKKAEIIKTATSSFEDEAEDFRYGPYLAGTLRDFINTCPNVDRYPNIREYVWGDMCYMAQTKEGKKQFLELFKGILEKTDKAKKQITEMISDIINRIKEYEISQIDEPQPEYSESEPEMEEPEGEDEIEKLIRSTQQGTIDSEEKEIKDMTPVELSEYIKSLRKSELQALIDQCIDSGDFATLGRLQPFIKESLEWKIYESEIKQFLK